MYVCSLCYYNGQETDGLVPFAALPFVHARKRDAELLVAYGLWKPHPRGWEVVNATKRNPSAATMAAKRADRALASRKANCVRWHGDDCGCWSRSDPDP